MADSIFNSLLNTIDSRTVGEVAHALGRPDQSVSRGMESSIAGLLSGLVSKSNDTRALENIFNTVPASAGDVSWSQMASSVATPQSTLMTAGNRLLGALFGNRQTAVTNGISQESGLPASAVTTLLAMAGPVVISFLSRHLRDRGMGVAGLPSLLQGESTKVRSALPPGVRELFWPGAAAATVASPVIAQTLQREGSWNRPIAAMIAAGLAFAGLLWFINHFHRPVAQAALPATRGAASRLATAPGPVCKLPENSSIPEGGVASRFLAFVQDPNATLSSNTSFNMDAMTFDTGSARLRPEAQAQLDNLATILSSCPSVHLAVAGHTDNVGSPASNLRLSRNRADGVVAQLVSKGISPDRLTAEGYGQESPVADNATAEGRAQNRRIAIRVTQK
jgi:outer membrane protein OmpA-like peptidoglycan-associated protein